MNSMNVDLIRAGKTRAILAFSVPAIISMVLTSLINVADGFFMGNFIHKDAIAAVNLGLPIIYLFLATGLMVSVGGSVLAGMSMGRKDEESCRSVFSQTMATCAVASVLLSVVMFFLLRTILAVLGAEGDVAKYFLQYYTILLFELPVMTVNASLGMFVRAEGRPQFYMGVTAFTCVLNILLDWLFTAGFGFGVRGIAAASLVSAVLGFSLLLFYFAKKARVFKFVKFRFDREVFKSTMLNGLSEFIGEFSMCISMAAYNFVIMRRIGVDGVTAFTVVGYTAYVFSMVVCGFGQGMAPLASFVYGAKEKLLARKLFTRTVLLVLAAGCATVAFVGFGSGWYSRIFVSDVAVQQMIKSGILIFMWDFVLCGLNAIASFYFTSIGKAKESAVISTARGLVILLASIFVLPAILGMNGIWLTSPATEILTLAITLFYLKKDRREIAE
ncbi:MATE family efflux transporter [uncultured Treponema sp.]|uniref:MATE family efflux transporter n=1 Tax=uncultured Treponema sp. TaxID=162155 RepID=UPI00258CA83B|nr:MATE family efflux transporter [uncultured Treponema sp.]